MLYLESPAGVGFSYSANTSDYFMVTDERTGFYNKINQYFTLILNLDFNNFCFCFWKLGIRSKDRLIRGDQSHRPLVGIPFKARAKLCMDLPTEIGRF